MVNQRPDIGHLWNAAQQGDVTSMQKLLEMQKDYNLRLGAGMEREIQLLKVLDAISGFLADMQNAVERLRLAMDEAKKT